MSKGTCTSLDHVYRVPKWGKAIKTGTPCYCGARKWGVEPARRAATKGGGR